ncbi:MAG: hypothetical protein HDQ97_09085 [Lachnospiraceae bacterium]|nr:hypothetical protein [Lachnospiraceae bacterium]
MLEGESSNFLKASNYLIDNYPQDKRAIVHVVEGYDTIETPDGIGFGVFVPETLEIFIAGDMPGGEESLIKTLAHEYKHFMQYCEGEPFNEEEAEEFAEEIYKKVTEKRCTCEYCGTPGETLAVIEEADPRIFISIQGAYLQIFNEAYPGFIENIKIKCCPMCGRNLEESK